MKDFKNSTRTMSGHSFPAEAGFTGSTGMVRSIKPYTRKVPTVKLAEGGSVGNATTQRSHATNELDEVAGGKTPLRPGFKKGGKNWIANAIKNKGALHRALKVPEGQKIPQAKLEKAESSKSPLMRKRAALAETLGALHRAEGGSVAHSDVKADKKLIKSMVKPSVLKRAVGGYAKGGKSYGRFNSKPVIGKC